MEASVVQASKIIGGNALDLIEMSSDADKVIVR